MLNGLRIGNITVARPMFTKVWTMAISRIPMVNVVFAFAIAVRSPLMLAVIPLPAP